MNKFITTMLAVNLLFQPVSAWGEENYDCQRAREAYDKYKAGTLTPEQYTYVKANLIKGRIWYYANCGRRAKGKAR